MLKQTRLGKSVLQRQSIEGQLLFAGTIIILLYNIVKQLNEKFYFSIMQMIVSLCCIIGVVMFAFYALRHPITYGDIPKTDQVIDTLTLCPIRTLSPLPPSIPPDYYPNALSETCVNMILRASSAPCLPPPPPAPPQGPPPHPPPPHPHPPPPHRVRSLPELCLSLFIHAYTIIVSTMYSHILF